jgi:hypothetical protein
MTDDNLTLEHPGAKVAAELADARAAEADAVRLHGESVLAAITGNKAVPSGIVKALEEATKRRAGLEAALEAADRAATAQAVQQHSDRRRQRLQDVEATLDELHQALTDIDVGLQAIAKAGAGPRARDAMEKLRGLCSDASEHALTPNGWHVAAILGQLRGKRGEWVNAVAGEYFGHALRGVEQTHGTVVLAQLLRRDLIADLHAQGPAWPVAAP